MSIFGIVDWTVHYEFKNIKGGLAETEYDTKTRGVTFTLNKKYDADVKEHSMERTAKHEVCHLLIADLSSLVGGYCTEEEHDRADEALVCRLTNIL